MSNDSFEDTYSVEEVCSVERLGSPEFQSAIGDRFREPDPPPIDYTGMIEDLRAMAERANLTLYEAFFHNEASCAGLVLHRAWCRTFAAELSERE